MEASHGLRSLRAAVSNTTHAEVRADPVQCSAVQYGTVQYTSNTTPLADRCTQATPYELQAPQAAAVCCECIAITALFARRNFHL